MSNIKYRLLHDAEVEEARQLSNRNPDVFGAYALEQLACFYDIADALEPTPQFTAKQHLMLGAFNHYCLVGTLFVGEIDLLEAIEEAAEEDQHHVLDNFSKHDINVYLTLASDRWNRMIQAIEGTLLIHTMCVDLPYRK